MADNKETILSKFQVLTESIVKDFSNVKNSLEDRLNSIEEFIGGMKKYYYVAGTVAAVKSKFVDVCSLSVPKGIYLVFGYMSASIADTGYQIGHVVSSDGQTISPIRNTMYAGGGACSVGVMSFSRGVNIAFSAYSTIDKAYDHKCSLYVVKIG